VNKKRIKTIVIFVVIIGILVFLIFEKSFDVLAGYSGLIALILFVMFIIGSENLRNEKFWFNEYLKGLAVDYLALISKEDQEKILRKMEEKQERMNEERDFKKFSTIGMVIFIALALIFYVLHKKFN
jgi:amino acid transporter